VAKTFTPPFNRLLKKKARKRWNANGPPETDKPIQLEIFLPL